MSPFTLAPKSLGVWFGGIFLLVGLSWNARAGAREVTEWRRRIGVGTPAQGIVTLVEQKVQRCGLGSWTLGWEVSYRYTDPHGRSRTGESGYLARRDAAQWRIGDACLVLFDPELPDKSVWIG